jgi:hypothetical protein
MQTSQVRITHEGEMYGCETCAPHEQDDAAAVDSVVDAMDMLTVIADGVKAVRMSLCHCPLTGRLLTVLNMRSRMRLLQSISRTLRHLWVVLLVLLGKVWCRSEMVG